MSLQVCFLLFLLGFLHRFLLVEVGFVFFLFVQTIYVFSFNIGKEKLERKNSQNVMTSAREEARASREELRNGFGRER